MLVFQDKYQAKLKKLLEVCEKNLRSFNPDLITKAFWFSYNAHKDNYRASGEPYFNHPYEVAMIVASEIPLDDISVASALLHDIVEDTNFTLEDIQAEFGEKIARIVDGLTKITGIFESDNRGIIEAENYRKLLLALSTDVRVILVKFADRLHNMRTLEYLPEHKRKRIAQETLEIYAPLAHRFGLAQIKWELEDLAFKYLNPEAYEDIARRVAQTRKQREEYIKEFAKPIEKALAERGFKFEISGRPKHLYSIYNKMVKRGKAFEEIYDLFAVRIILDTEDKNDCWTVYGIVTDIYRAVPERFKDYITNPKSNGYRSIHTTVIGPGGKMVEVQIRTRAMHEIAEKGLAAHWKYKENITETDKQFEEWVRWVRDILENQTDMTQFIEDLKLNLFQDEIYVFTPKGDLKVLPRGATPVDFAFEIHTEIGLRCIGAKVNGRIVPLDYKLKTGDQVEIITGKHRSPSKDWEKFVVTSKAKAQIRKWINEEKRRLIDVGKEIWDKKVKRAKLHINDDELLKIVRELYKFDNLSKFYLAIAEDGIDVSELIKKIEERQKHKDIIPRQLEERKESVVEEIIKPLKVIAIDGGLNFLYTFAKCCNPVPGDEIVGFVTTGEGIKIHRKDCINVAKLKEKDEDRFVDVIWSKMLDGMSFPAGIVIEGEDRPGMLKEITTVISGYQNTNIRMANIQTDGPIFHGLITVEVKDLEHLNVLMDKLRRINGVYSVSRYQER
ncbi:GTP pyrophosphokinase [Candidatus Thermokryptus mobilis]|uniref:GTP pyrophosphokinase n=1 Tax=Candidatus Thermokryptus mobilis TaxID=1643428 RepID=A0A0S4MWF5_9BACT|nr:bifunctional (p)ppGpp synthetase/guanosine-3',5'-bis(diphosphate) 3'-pyrophosphohydrolase [Candidatus Thermokryptus mobilis]CUU02358.1 GTP pyrophosphokinase [Candidatus Thermokryptus mobilis]